jgi:hypothetical protein
MRHDKSERRAIRSGRPAGRHSKLSNTIIRDLIDPDEAPINTIFRKAEMNQLATDKQIRQTLSVGQGPSPRTFAEWAFYGTLAKEGSSTELPGGAVNVHPANNAYARIGRAGPGLAGPGKSSPWISSRQ